MQRYSVNQTHKNPRQGYRVAKKEKYQLFNNHINRNAHNTGLKNPKKRVKVVQIIPILIKKLLTHF